MSSLSDAAGAGEEKRKGGTPKEWISCKEILGHRVNNHMTVIWNGWGAIEDMHSREASACIQEIKPAH